MKWSFASIGVILIGLFGIIIILMFNEITVSNEQDYYTLKEATEAAMLESVDVAYYRLTGQIKISKEKFVENFTRRFTETSTFGQGNYDIEFYQISETQSLDDIHQEKKNKKLTRFFDVVYIDIQDPSKNFLVKNAYITPQGTSSMNYPVKNLRLYTGKKDKAGNYYSRFYWAIDF